MSKSKSVGGRFATSKCWSIPFSIKARPLYRHLGANHAPLKLAQELFTLSCSHYLKRGQVKASEQALQRKRLGVPLEYVVAREGAFLRDAGLIIRKRMDEPLQEGVEHCEGVRRPRVLQEQLLHCLQACDGQVELLTARMP